MMSAEERLSVLREAKPNTWIAFSVDEDRVIGRGETFEEAAADAEKHGDNDPVLTFVPETWSPTLL